ncbi:MAG: hypothetical protein OEU92_25395, partial [Alphaproteobacteria bacterium]|nr:hypothetical protein [Alphaproteobacteria bacterium]
LESDPEFARHFVTSTGSTRTDRWGHLVNSIRRVETGRVFGAFLDWYGYEMITRSPERFEKLGFVPIPLGRIEIPLFGEPPTFLAISRNQPDHVRQATFAAYAEIRANGTFEALWQKWHGDRAIPPDVRIESQ